MYRPARYAARAHRRSPCFFSIPLIHARVSRMPSKHHKTVLAIGFALVLAGCKGGKTPGAAAETSATEPAAARPSVNFVAQTTGSAASLLQHLRQLESQYSSAKQDDVETSHANLLAYSRAMEQTGDALLANKEFPSEARMTGAKAKLKSIRDRIELEPAALDQFMAAADKLETEDPKSLIPQLAAYARFDTVSKMPVAAFGTPKAQLQKTIDAVVRLANVEPILPDTAELVENFGLMAELRDDPKRAAMLFELMGKRFPDHPANKFVPGSVHRLELRGKPVTDIQGKDFDGNPVDLKNYRGKVVLVDFWASWCKPCAQEMPDLKEMRLRLAPIGFEVLAVCVDEDPRRGRFAIESTKMPWPQILDERESDGVGSKLAIAYGIAKIPHKLVIDPQGVLVASGVDLKELGPALNELFQTQAKKKLDEMVAAKAKKSADEKKSADRSEKPKKADSEAVDAPRASDKKP
jgi:thiol-disulfide isomerase/thioredoxin